MAFTREDAEKKCIDLQGKQYLEVKWRMVWFRETCPQGTIDTEELVVDLDREVAVELFRWEDDPARPGKKRKVAYTKTAKGYARFRAIVTDGNGARATGTKSECAANFDDYIEKAETGSIGRALAALGYGTQFTGDELDEGKRIVDSPVTKPAGDIAPPQQNGNQSEDDDNPTLSIGSLKLFCRTVYGDDIVSWKKVVAFVTKPEKSGRGDVPDEALTLADRKGVHATLIARQKANAAKAS